MEVHEDENIFNQKLHKNRIKVFFNRQDHTLSKIVLSYNKFYCFVSKINNIIFIVIVIILIALHSI